MPAHRHRPALPAIAPLAALSAVVVAALCLGGCVLLLAVAAGVGPGAVPGVPARGRLAVPARGRLAVPARWEELEREAAATCRGLAWSVLAAIGLVESDSGRSTAPGVHSGANSAGAEGPFQFEPATFAAYAVVGPGGAVPASPYDPVDAAYSAAHLLCVDGGGRPGGLARAVAAYDHARTYVDTVLVLALAIGTDPSLGAAPAAALSFAGTAIGAPYRWGGTGTGGFDCSGLVQAAERAAGVTLPRVAQDQFDAGPPVAPGSPLVPGDLVFFGSSASRVTHVGLYVGGGQMVDAPHPGARVRLEPAGWPAFVGATRPS